MNEFADLVVLEHIRHDGITCQGAGRTDAGVADDLVNPLKDIGNRHCGRGCGPQCVSLKGIFVVVRHAVIDVHDNAVFRKGEFSSGDGLDAERFNAVVNGLDHFVQVVEHGIFHNLFVSKPFPFQGDEIALVEVDFPLDRRNLPLDFLHAFTAGDGRLSTVCLDFRHYGEKIFVLPVLERQLIGIARREQCRPDIIAGLCGPRIGKDGLDIQLVKKFIHQSHILSLLIQR